MSFWHFQIFLSFRTATEINNFTFLAEHTFLSLVYSDPHLKILEWLRSADPPLRFILFIHSPVCKEWTVGELYREFFGFFMYWVPYFIQHCFICRPSSSSVSEDAGIEPRIVATLALTVRLSNNSDRSLCNAVPCRHKASFIHWWNHLASSLLHLLSSRRSPQACRPPGAPPWCPRRSS